MRREDTEFWNGALKGVLAAELELEDIESSLGKASLKGFAIAKAALSDIRRRIERLHGASLREFLERNTEIKKY